MKRTGRVSYKTILIFQEYLIDKCMNGDMRIGQAISNYIGWTNNNGDDPYHMEENEWIEHFCQYVNKQDTAKSDAKRTE